MHHFRLYLRLLNVQLVSQIQYRTSFIFQLLGTALISSLEFASLALAMQRFEFLGGWNIGEIAFLVGLVEVGFGAMDMIFSGFDPQYFGQSIRKGSFDQVLLRPIPSGVQVLGSDLGLRRIGRIVTGFIILFYSFSVVPIAWTAIKILLIPVLIVSLLIFFGALFVIGATFTFWTVDAIEVMNILTYGGSYVISHPMHVLQSWLRNFFTFIVPAIFLNYYPALYILGKQDPVAMPAWAPFAAPFVAAAALWIAAAFWRYGIRHYQSSGS